MKRSRNQTELPMEKPVPKALTDDEVARKNNEIRAAIRAIKGLKSKMRDDTREGKRSIKEHEMEIDVLIDQIDQGIEMRKQGDLFAGDEAKRALASVAAAAGEPKPSEPHAFDGARKECGICGAEKIDPIHGNGKGGAFGFTGEEPADPIVRTHRAVDTSDKKRARVLNRRARRAEKGGRV